MFNQIQENAEKEEKLVKPGSEIKSNSNTLLLFSILLYYLTIKGTPLRSKCLKN
jgi:hypothetical protein